MTVSQQLQPARRYEEQARTRAEQAPRPAFHLAPLTGWMNDPNGFSRYGGQYHLFYQYYPYAAHWDDMHWGHAVSQDLLHWTPMPCALAPDESYDRAGCFSGSAIELEDGRHLLMYTGVQKERTPDQEETILQTQILAVGDGTDYEKLADGPVLTAADLPQECTAADFRDPKLWRTETGTYLCVTGCCDDAHDGRIVLFESPDAFHWQFRSVLIRNNGRFGRMWECPDFFPLDGQWVLLTSPQDMREQEGGYHCGNGNLCLIGSFDEETGQFTPEHDQPVDEGLDFYATQTIQTEDGRRVMIAWMQNWDTLSIREPDAPWMGQMTLPRELSVRNGRLIQQPVRELETLYRETLSYQDQRISGAVRFDGITGRQLDLELELRPEEGTTYRAFTLHFAEDADEETYCLLRVCPGEQSVTMDRIHSGTRRALVHSRTCTVPACGEGHIRLRLILDRFSAELFINDGEQTMSMTFYTPMEAQGITFACEGTARIDLTAHIISE
ncbi:MAG: glycoside hydrolase family 32 protein [Butyrivibrio sp.]|nr:glycoside hydrolase family 32 protein [Butyrivibrio sp.]